jgi:hypothetical protein
LDYVLRHKGNSPRFAIMEMPPEKEADLAADFTASDTSLGKKKRSNSEAAEYPRRRATIAVSAFDIVEDTAD